MKIPDSMKTELGQWNNGRGIDLEDWIGCMGNFALATGYISLFWPRFVEFEGYILREGFSLKSLRAWEASEGSNRMSIEWVMNHLHISDIHYNDNEHLAEDKVIVLGEALEEIYRAKLASQFPDSPCRVEFHRPEPDGNIEDYQISFWQLRHEPQSG